MAVAHYENAPPWNLKDEGWHFELITSTYSNTELREMKIWLENNFGSQWTQFDNFMSRWWAGPTPTRVDAATLTYLIGFKDNEDRLIYKLRWP